MTKEDYQEKVLKAFHIWENELSRTKKELAGELEKYRKDKGIVSNFPTSESTLSKVKTDLVNVKQTSLKNLADALDNILLRDGFRYDEAALAYKGEKPDLAPKGGNPQALKNMAGLYETYHLDKHALRIVKGIVQIKPDGNVIKKGIRGNEYFGKAYVYQTNLLCVQFHLCQSYPFYAQTICHIGNYAQVGFLQENTHFYGVSSTVSMDNEPMACSQAWVRLGASEADFDQFLPSVIEIQEKDAHFVALKQQRPQVLHYLQQRNKQIIVSTDNVDEFAD